jgi:rod shape determining protein RodA
MFLFDRHYLRSFDWISFLLTLMLAGIGLLFIFSATYKIEQPYSLYFHKQLFGVISGLGIYFLFCFINHRTLLRLGYFAYFGVIGLLCFTIVKGAVAMGGQRWIQLGFIKIQPSELTKLLFPAFVTYYLYGHNNQRAPTIKDFMPILAVLGISFILILKQPDLGTALILAFSGIIMLWLAGLPKKIFVCGILIGTLALPLGWHILKDYQKQRIFVFLGYGDARKERYQIEQSTIAIGSGGMIGKGFLCGTQNKLNFLPESRTDFIFSVIAEEIGFTGALSILLLYLLLFWRFFLVISTIKAPLLQLLATGLVLHIVLSTIINIGMVIGLLPIVGIPLPLISYGVSNLWVVMATLGWFNGIAMRRFYINT